MKCFIVCHLLALSTMGWAQYSCDYQEEPRGAVSMTQPVTACSRYLSCIIEQICGNHLRIIKRDTSSFMNKLVPDDLQDFVNKKRLVDETRHRPKRQVINECCMQSCTVQDLIMYCPSTSKIYDDFPIGDP